MGNPVAKISLLVVDDDKTTLEFLRVFLAETDCEIRSAPNAEGCFREISLKKPNLVLLDVHAAGLDGLNTVEILKRSLVGKSLPVLLMSGTSDLRTLTVAKQLGAVDFLSKPFDPSELEAKLNARMKSSPKVFVARATSPRSMEVSAAEAPRVLVVDEHAVSRELAVLQIRSLGYPAQGADCGKQAMAILDANAGIELVFMECDLPDLHDAEALRMMRARRTVANVALPVVALTASVIHEEKGKWKACGWSDYLPKPSSKKDLTHVLNAFIGGGAERVASAAPTIDKTVLDVLGDITFIIQLIEAYLSTTPDVLSDLQRAVGMRDSKEVTRTAHSLKSSSAQMGALVLSDLCFKLEQLGNRESLTGLTDLVTEMEAEFLRTTEALKALKPQIKRAA